MTGKDWKKNAGGHGDSTKKSKGSNEPTKNDSDSSNSNSKHSCTGRMSHGGSRKKQEGLHQSSHRD